MTGTYKRMDVAQEWSDATQRGCLGRICLMSPSYSALQAVAVRVTKLQIKAQADGKCDV